MKARKGAVLKDDEAAIREFLADYLVQKNFSLRGALERGMHNDLVVQGASALLLDTDTRTQLLSVTE